ncbi:STAS domain-containing protein [Croceicoccus sp. YJ47]|uniref:STAS domain-containing protein n=1 Tax=Croceicoccus sp. YJ47 TaxID=2798724 RepID=UPI001922CF4B|nr:STAS domain-containing protein [Croceicoccus sp. YJ47]QQN74325.1 STAS domain-containing protein [Croceicoccus sp. YJ47]
MESSVRSAISVRIPAEVTLPAIPGIYDEVIAAFEQDGAIEFAIGDLKTADLAFVQLVEAARRDARAGARDLRLSHPVSPPVTQLLRRAGFLTQATSDDIAFWFHGEIPQ